jgi:hypothetical protein
LNRQGFNVRECYVDHQLVYCCVQSGFISDLSCTMHELVCARRLYVAASTFPRQLFAS